MRVLRAHALLYAALAAVGAVAIVFGLNAVYGFIDTSSSAGGVQRTATVTQGLIQSSVSASGNVSPAQSATAGFASSGTVTAVDVTVGQHVKVGQVLGKVDPTSAQDTLLAAQANLEQAQSALSTAESGLTTSQRISNTMSLQQDSDAITSDKQQLATDRTALATEQALLATDRNLSCPAATAAATNAASSSSTGSSDTSSSSSSDDSSTSGASGTGGSSDSFTGGSSSSATSTHNTVEASGTGASGTTGASAVTVGPAVTGAASALGADTATLAGTVSPDGTDTTYWFAYGISASDLSHTTSHLDAGSGTGEVTVSIPVSGLTPATTYYFQLIEQNSTGSSTGAQETFATVAAAAPTVISGSGSSELTTVLQLSGTVNPNSTATTYWFEYGTTSAYGSRTAAVSAGSGSTPSEVSADVSGLRPDTQYLFRLVAENAFGTTDGLAVVATTAQSSCVTDQQTITTDEQTITHQQETIATATESLAQERASIASAEKPAPATVTADEAAVSEDEATVTTDQKDLAETTLTAPISGVVTAVNDTVGEAVTAGGSSTTSAAAAANTSSSSGSSASSFTGGSSSSGDSSSSSSGFVTIDSLGQLEIVAGFAEADATKIAVGEPATITFPALTDVDVAGKVVAVSNTSSVVSNVVTYNETIALVNPPSEVKDGMTADVSVIDQTVANALQLPSSAITTTGTVSTVELLRDGKTTVTRVVTGLVGNTTTQIISGLSVGEVVVEPTVTITASTTSSSGSTGFGSSTFAGLGGGGGGFTARSGG